MRPIELLRRGIPSVACFGAGSLYGWSGYALAVTSAFEIGHSATAMVFSFALASFTVGVLLGPALVQRLPPQLRLASLAFFAALCASMASVSTGYEVFLTLYGIGFGASAGMVYNYAVSEAARSSGAKILVPLAVAAFGLGGAVFGPLASFFAQAGWALWSNAPATLLLFAVALASLIFTPESPPNAPAHATKGFAISKPNLETVRLWVIFAAGSCTGLMVLGLAGQVISHGQQDITHISTAVFLVAMGNVVGRLAAAVTAPALGPARAIAGALLLSMTVSMAMLFAQTTDQRLALLFLVALAYGHIAANVPLLVRARVSETAFPTAFGWVFTGWGFAGLTAPWAAGYLLDATGGFTVILIVCLCLNLLSLILVQRYFPGRTTEPNPRIGGAK